jgi:hypothetical protein
MMLVILASCSAMNGKHANLDNCNVRIGGAVLSAAAEHRFDYSGTVAAACHGSNSALVDLLLFTDKKQTEKRAWITAACCSLSETVSAYSLSTTPCSR